MKDKIEALNARIKMRFAETKKPISIMSLQERVSDMYPSHDILAVALKSLVDRGTVRVRDGFILPIDDEGIIRTLEGDDRHTVKREGILRVLELIGHGTPAEVGSAYLKFIDSKVNVESVPRILRFMFADNEVQREGETYSTSLKASKTLEAFV